MPTSAAGNEPGRPGGFTLIELLVVIALIAIVSAGARLALRDSAASALERDAQRLAAMLEAARAQSRASGAPVFWRTQPGGFVLQGLPRQSAPQTWLSDQTRAEPGPALQLGTEPLLTPQRVTLYSAQQPTQRLQVGSDGLRPFAVLRPPAGGPP